MLTLWTVPTVRKFKFPKKDGGGCHLDISITDISPPWFDPFRPNLAQWRCSSFFAVPIIKTSNCTNTTWRLPPSAENPKSTYLRNGFTDRHDQTFFSYFPFSYIFFPSIFFPFSSCFFIFLYSFFLLLLLSTSTFTFRHLRLLMRVLGTPTNGIWWYLWLCTIWLASMQYFSQMAIYNWHSQSPLTPAGATVAPLVKSDFPMALANLNNDIFIRLAHH